MQFSKPELRISENYMRYFKLAIEMVQKIMPQNMKLDGFP